MMNWTDHYKDAVISNIRYGKKDHSNTLYAQIIDTDTNRLLVSATLDYCVERMKVVAEAFKQGEQL